jgi:hypothetical protein
VNREDIIRMAREAGFEADMFGRGIWDSSDFNRFAALVAAHEREACAKACEDEAAEFRSQKEGCRDARYDWKEDAAMECSLAIRKRGEVKP